MARQGSSFSTVALRYSSYRSASATVRVYTREVEDSCPESGWTSEQAKKHTQNFVYPGTGTFVYGAYDALCEN